MVRATAADICAAVVGLDDKYGMIGLLDVYGRNLPDDGVGAFE